jgi:phage terminase small subunit
MKMRKDQLTARQKLFCELYVGPGRHCAALAARLAGYAPGCSHVTGCQLLKLPKIAATVQGLEDAVSLGIGVSRQAVISQLVAAADQAKLMMEPSSIISAMKNIAQICGYYRREEVKSAVGEDDGGLMDQLRGMSDQELMRLVEAGA